MAVATMTTALTNTVDLFTAQAVMASDFLVRLYRVLGDEKQAVLAQQARGSCEERATRLGLKVRIQALRTVFADEHPGETQAEEKAWNLLVESQAGLAAFYGLVGDHESGGSLRGQRTSTEKALQKALRGYRVAFPEEMANQGILDSIEIAADRCAETFTLDVEDASEEERSELRRELYTNVLNALMVETGFSSAIG